MGIFSPQQKEVLRGWGLTGVGPEASRAPIDPSQEFIRTEEESPAATAPSAISLLQSQHEKDIGLGKEALAIQKNPKTLDEWIASMSDTDLNAIYKEHPHLKSQVGTDKEGKRIFLGGNAGPKTEGKGLGGEGGGTIELLDKETGKKVIKTAKVVNEPRGIGDEGIDISGMNVKQATALAHIMTAKHGDEIAKQRNELLREQNALNRASREEIAKAKIEEGHLAKFAHKTVDESGKEHMNEPLTYLNMALSGTVPKGFETRAAAAKKRYDLYANTVKSHPKNAALLKKNPQLLESNILKDYYETGWRKGPQ